MSSKVTLSVKMSAITLDPIGLDNLASEYYGAVVVPAGGEDASDTQVIEFEDRSHDDTDTWILASDMVKSFQQALDSFLVKKHD